MAHSVSARKRIRQNEKRNARNRWRKRVLKDILKDLSDKLIHATYPECLEPFKLACRTLDRTAQKGVIHKNVAARTKSRLAKKMKIKNLGAAAKS